MTQTNPDYFDSQAAIANMTHEEQRTAYQTALLALVRGAKIPAKLSSPSPEYGGVDYYKADDAAGRFMFAYEPTRGGARVEIEIQVNSPGNTEVHIHCSSGGYSGVEAVQVAALYAALGALAIQVERLNQEWRYVTEQIAK
jgi:hypothetical protein